MAIISVIVPVYKVEAYLDRCVSSILCQSFSDFELILVDDGSPDNCGALCDAYAQADSRICVIHQENGGLSAARNAGMDYALRKGECQWLAFVDSDDWIHPEYLQTLYQAVQQTGCKLSACGCQRTAGEPLTHKQDLSIRQLAADDYYCGSFHEKATPVAWNKLYHISLFETLRYPVGKLHEDEFTTYRAVYQAQLVAVTEAKLYAYYQNQQGITLSQWNPRRLHALEGIESQLAFARDERNQRLLKHSGESYLYGIVDQMRQADSGYHGMLRKKLRSALALGRQADFFPVSRQNLWAYELAWPCKPLWWLLGKLWR